MLSQAAVKTVCLQTVGKGNVIKMKQKKTEDSFKSSAKPSVRKVGTMLGCGALAVLMVGTVSIFGLTGNSVKAQKDTKAAITNTKTTSVTEAETERDETYTSMNTVTWKKAGISEYEMAEVQSETTTVTTTAEKKKTTTTAAKETKVDSVKMYATEIVNIRQKADKNSEIAAILDAEDEVVVSAETSDGWYKVTYGDYSGYVMKEYLTKTVPESVKAAQTEKKTETSAETKKTTAASTEKSVETQKVTAQTAKKSETKKTETTTAAKTEAGEKPVISYTDEEFDMLCYVLQGEVGNCSEDSKIAVANVIINRVKSGRFGSSIKAVLTAPNQFTAISGYYNGRNKPSSNTVECAERALYGEDNSNGATYYYAPKYCGGSTASWFESLTFCMELDGQRYFKN